MIVTRRAMLVGLGWPSPTDKATPEVFGAVGDGRADDGPALLKLSCWINAAPDRTAILCGRYRVGRSTHSVSGDFAREGALTILRPRGSRIIFDGGSIEMDNLDPHGHGDQRHGIYVEGPGDGLAIINPVVVWVKPPLGRSQGDGIRLHGFPSDAGCIRKVRIKHSLVRSAPQVGLIIIGCSDVTVDQHEAIGTLADGCHVNASRRISLGVISALNSGDDCCAFVTYLSHKTAGIYGNDSKDPFGLPDYGSFSNSSCSVERIEASGGGASGLRLAQSSVRVGKVSAFGKEQAVIADGGLKGRNYDWSNLQPSKCTIDEICADKCDYGLHVRSFNNVLSGGNTSTDLRLYTVGLHVKQLAATNCRSGMTVRDVAGLALGTATLEGRIEVANVHGCRFDNIAIASRSIYIDDAARSQFKRLTIMST